MKLDRTTQRTVKILKLVSENPGDITLDEICDRLQLPKTSGYDVVIILAEMGIVNVVRGQKQRYAIGFTAYRIGINHTNSLDFIGIIEPELKAFARGVGKTVFFDVRSGHKVVHICKTESENPIITTATVDTKNPIYCTSLGKAILALSDGEIKQQVMSRIKCGRKTEQTILSREALGQEFKKVQAKGYASDAREVEDHMECVGAPVFGPDGSVLGAISVSGLYKPTKDYEAPGMLVGEKAARVSKISGYLPPKALTNPAG